jgi:hypothetical protein
MLIPVSVNVFNKVTAVAEHVNDHSNCDSVLNCDCNHTCSCNRNRNRDRNRNCDVNVPVKLKYRSIPYS